ncbi:MAG TPA: DUF805 domain-containing protein [Porphyromonadaceae bacterium]|nr:DUF805 domain-containing protein [Porphyromonadaceae bacterium]
MFKNVFSFKGRIRRTEYGLSVIIAWAVSFAFNLILESLYDVESGSLAVLFLYIPFFWFCFAQAVKRCHDVGNCGWWSILPIYNPFVLIFQEGNKGYNEYGADPKNNSVPYVNNKTETKEMEEVRAIILRNTSKSSDIKSKMKLFGELKELLDSGAITQEEFEKMKNDIKEQ